MSTERRLHAGCLAVAAFLAATDAPAQSPAAGEEVDPGSTLTLSVSGGSPPVTVPDLIGLNEAQAGVRLTEAGFEYRINRETSDQPSGIVIAQEPAPGAKADEGAPRVGDRFVNFAGPRPRAPVHAMVPFLGRKVWTSKALEA